MTLIKSHGLTLLELLIVLLICSILLLLCQIDFSAFMRGVGSETDAHRFFHTLAFARQAAIKGNQLVCVCPTKNQKDCDEDWSQGYMVFYPAPDNKTIERLRVIQTHPYTHIRSKNTPLIQFSGDGRCLNRTTFHIEATQPFKVVIYDSGRIRLAAP